MRFEIEQQVAEGELVMTRYVMRGTHRGPWLGLPATNRSVTVRMTHTVRVVAGKIVEDWLLAEWYGLLEQLGLVPTTMTIKISPNDKGNPAGKLAEAEVHFTDGPLAGLKLIDSRCGSAAVAPAAT